MAALSFADRLLQWFDENRRAMPWRDEPTPYRVWISEIMLQQTRVTTATPYFLRFVEKVPDVYALAVLPEEDLLVLWQGLGYYSRALNLKKAAIQVVAEHDGVLPGTKEELLTLPGIGDYTAGAIASIAFGETVTAIDGNVLRVFARVLNRTDDIKKEKTKKVFAPEVEKRLSNDRPGDFNQALMELGALICVPKNPKCEECPVCEHCEAYQAGVQNELPVRIDKTKTRRVQMTAFLLRDGEEVAIRKREDAGLLKKMWEFFHVQGHLAVKEAKGALRESGYEVISIKAGPRHTHVFSHVEWEMISYIANVQKIDDSLTWVAAEELADYAIPSAFSFLVERLADES